MEVAKKLKLEVPFDPAISLLGIYPKELKSASQGDICIAIFMEALFPIVKIWKQLNCPSVNKWVKNIQKMKYYSTLKKKKKSCHL